MSVLELERWAFKVADDGVDVFYNSGWGKKEFKHIGFISSRDLERVIGFLRKQKWSVKEMNKKTLNALKGSIRKWEKIVNGTGVDFGGKNCPLCKLFPFCEDCPVFLKTWLKACENTPYEAWLIHQNKVHNRHGWRMPESGLKVLCPECKRIAERELKFLKSLLPEEECDL